MRPLLRLLMIIALALTLGACSGAKGMVRLDTLKYPASTTAHLYGPEYQVLSVDKDLEKVGKLNLTTRLWSTLWGFLKLSGSKEIGQKMNDKISKAGGQGVVNISFKASSCGMNNFYQYTWNLLNIIPIMPGCVKVRLKGDIVRLSGT